MRLPTDGTLVPGLRIDSGARLSWLLATSRVYSEAPGPRRRTEFAAALTALGIRADRTRISRWESGAIRMPDSVVAGYEHLLGRQPGALMTVAAGVQRSLDPTALTRPLVVCLDPDRAPSRDALFERVMSGRHTGLHWTLLAAAIETSPDLYVPQAVWTDLCERVLRELLCARNLGWIRRFEAARTLARTPAAQHAMLRAIGAEVTKPGAQAIEAVVALLAQIDQQPVTDLLLRMLTGPDGGAFRGAAWALSLKLLHGQVGEHQTQEIAEVAARLVVRRDKTLRPEAVSLLAAVPDEVSSDTIATFVPAAARTGLHYQIEWNESVSAREARRTATAIAQRTQASRVTTQHIEHDEMLARLIREALFHVHASRRHQASLLLSQSPYAAPLAGHLLDQIAGDPSVADGGLMLLRYLNVDEDARGRLLTWAMHHPEPKLRVGAILALSQLRTPMPQATQRQLADLATTADPEIVAALTHSLGVVRSTELDRVAEVAEEPDRSTARWWLDLGARIDDEPCPGHPGED
ncbi:hypothetical protein GCM10028801_00220 [Nocardioides maradonensis]